MCVIDTLRQLEYHRWCVQWPWLSRVSTRFKQHETPPLSFVHEGGHVACYCDHEKRKACSDEDDAEYEGQGSTKKQVTAGPNDEMEGVEL